MSIIIGIVGVVCLVAGYFAALFVSRRSASSRANTILEEARREAEVTKEKKILEAKEEEMRLIADAERASNQRIQRAQSAEARAKQREIQLKQQEADINRAKKDVDSMRQSVDARSANLQKRDKDGFIPPLWSYCRRRRSSSG